MESLMYSSYPSPSDGRSDESSYRMDSAIPRWKIPLSKSYSTSFYSEKKPISPVVEEDSGRRSKDEENEDNDLERGREMDAQAIIQILLPCIICNRTFSPEALERHSRICTKVNITEKKPSRPAYDSHAQRIKNTRVADFIPPPDPRDPPIAFSRSSSFRRSLQGRTSMKEKTPLSPPTDTPRRIRAASIPKTLIYQDSDNFGANSSDFGSSEDSGENVKNLPSYARALSPSEDCPYCLRSFGLKAYDRHVSFCREVWERRQFEIQPMPKEMEEARERQEVRTKYRPIKVSNSCSNLHSMSPGKDTVHNHNFATVALNKLFGSIKSGRYSFKKSNESLTTSCYGDFARSRSIRQASPGRHTQLSRIPTAMKLNTNSNLPTNDKTKSTERLETVPSSGYGPGGHYMNNFLRNSKMRSSLGRSFFQNGKRSEPEGLENTSNLNNHNNQSPLIITPMNFYNKSNYIGTNQQPKSESITKSTLMTSDTNYDPYEKAAKQLEELLKCQPQPQPQRANTQRKIGVDRALASVMGLSNNNSQLSGNSAHNSNKLQAPLRRSYNQLHSYLREDDPFTNISADESYWDEILRAKNKEKEKQDALKSDFLNNRPRDCEREILRIDEKRDSSDSSSENFKYRGISNISSADSAFSRSDGTDLEFEALESLMSAGNLPKSTTVPTRRFGSSNQRFQAIQRDNQDTAVTAPSEEPNNGPSNQSFRNQYQKNHFSKDNNIVSNSLTAPQQKLQQLLPTYAKFCHECGISYPTPVAKFCPECGERRVIHV